MIVTIETLAETDVEKSGPWRKVRLVDLGHRLEYRMCLKRRDGIQTTPKSVCSDGRLESGGSVSS